MHFDIIPGHIKLKQELIALVDNNRLPHAILFTGPTGNAKLAFALALSSYIQCANKNGEDKCGSCSACKKTTKLIHPDINYTIPVSGAHSQASMSENIGKWRKLAIENPFIELSDWLIVMNAESKLANINKDAILAVNDYYNYTRFEGSKKIMIIWNAELMGNEGNRLLKLIEEPPADSLIILIAEDTSKILKTILSRCQTFRVPPFSYDELENWASEKSNSDTNLTRQKIAIADGNINRLISFFSEDQTDYFDLFLKWLNTAYIGKTDQILKFAEEFARMSRENQKQFFSYILKFLEQAIKSFYLDETGLKLTEKEKILWKN
jgi:DNA polymerase-3 subunit delta'